MYYIVQKDVFKEANYNNVIHALDRLNLEYEIVDVIPFVEDFEFKTNRKDVFPFGSLKMARLSQKYGWCPGSQMNDNHDYMVYKDYYKHNLLNYDSKIIRINDKKFFSKEPFFARPTKDTKVFTGQIFDMYSWEESVKNALHNANELKKQGFTTILDENTEVQISTIKDIKKEIRFWIVKGKIITASQYKLGKRIVLSDIIDKTAYTFCEKMIKLFELNDAFVMDIALTNDGYKIVECGCINCAGFYVADMQKVIMAIEDTKWNC